ncbi:MAG: carbohydrate porin [Verrucomicrobia bacterium]|nr:carbohydrate porin [Verrucomicrobiota bacterium]
MKSLLPVLLSFLLLLPFANCGRCGDLAPSPAEPPKSWIERDNLLPDPVGLRARLADKGVVFSLLYTAEEFGNPVGGRRQGQVYDGLVAAGCDVDFEKLLGGAWKGLQFHVLSYYPHGASGTNKYVGDLGRFSNIDAYDSVRLFELWLDGTFFNGWCALRLGQLATDAEFATSDGGALFINSDFGALPTFALNLPVPTYPYAAPGVRLRVSPPGGKFYFQGAAYDGNPDPATFGDPTPGSQPSTTYNRNGIHFNINSHEGAFLIGQFGYRLNREPDAKGLPGTYRVGAFYHTDTFSDERLDSLGRSLADPRSSGLARARDGNYGAYFSADQNVYVAHGAAPFAGPDSTASAPVGNVADNPGAGASSSAAAPAAPAAPSGFAAAVFLRVGVAPEDRNNAPCTCCAGCNIRGLLPCRPKDVFGIAFAYVGISDARRQLARDRERFTGVREALPDYENVLEITYQGNVTPWMQLQPDLQYIAHPGGSGAFGNALVLGLRSVVTF